MQLGRVGSECSRWGWIIRKGFCVVEGDWNAFRELVGSELRCGRDLVLGKGFWGLHLRRVGS